MAQRKRINRFARLISLIHDKPYREVEKLYFKCERDVHATRNLINTI